MNTYRLALGKAENSSTIENITRTWPEIADKLVQHRVSANKGGAYLIGGYFNGNVRKTESMVARSLLCLDIDNYSGDISTLEFDLTIWLNCAFVAYSSFRHTSDNPRVRVVIPMSQELSPEEYRVFAKSFCGQSIIPMEAFDECSWKPNQAMFMPQHPAGGEFWTYAQEGKPLSVSVQKVDAEPESFDDMIASQPLDLSDEEVKAYLIAYPAASLNYDEWVRVGMALWHQYTGADTGLQFWLEWSRQDAERFNERDFRAKWKSFGGSSNPVTMASVIHHVNQGGGIAAIPNAFDELFEDATKVKTLEQFDIFAKRIHSMSDAVLQPVRRGVIVSALADGFGKANNIGKLEIRRELQYRKRGTSSADEEVSDVPEWLAPWVYVETPCLFAHTEIADYAIRREAFNAKFDRKSDCLSLEKRAADAALVNFRIKTVADTMFFPGANKFFDYDGKQMLNSYSAKGVVPCGRVDTDGQAVVDMFLRHLAFTIESEAEQQIMLNWMAYIYQNPGKRVGWAMLLQGAQGCGKSYFGAMFQQLWGSNVRQLDTGAISGRFTGWAHGALLNVVEEIRIAGTNKWEILDKLKPIISNDTIQIEEKGRDHRTVPNFTSYLLLTNHKDAVPIGDGDRRYCCIFSRIQSEEQLLAHFGTHEGRKQYFDKLFDETRRRPDAIARFLADYEISAGFDPIGRAPVTSARSEMRALSASPDRDDIEDAIDRHSCDVINDEIVDLTWLGKLVEGEGGRLPKTRAVASILSEMGYSPIEGRRVKISGKGHHYLWIKKGAIISEIKAIVKNYHNASTGINEENIPF